MTTKRSERVEGTSPVCSAKGCREAAAWVLAWNNPKLHTPDRRKVWTACDEHRTSLSSFLETRGFLREVVPVAEWGDGTGRTPAATPGSQG